MTTQNKEDYKEKKSKSGDSDSGIYYLVKAQTKENPDAVAIVAPQRSLLTYQLLCEQIDKVVVQLNFLGIVCNDRVAVALPNGPEMAVAFLAIASAATCAPLNPNYRANEFDFYLKDLKAKALIVQAGVAEPARAVAEQLGILVIELEPVLEAEAGIFKLKAGEPKSPASSGFAQAFDVALVLHTSGTTSRPKIVPLTHASICASANNIRIALGLDESDRCLNVMPLFHIHGLIGTMLSSLSAGASVICTPGFYAPKFFEWLEEFRPTWYSAVPTMHQAILARASANRKVIAQCPLRLIRSSSASLPPQVTIELEKVLNVPVIESYGMTEASHQMASNPLPPKVRKPGSVGLAAGPEIAIMDETGNLLPRSEVGEVVIRGANVTQGYENNPEANQSAFTKGWFRTGDLGYLDADGYLFLKGRIKEIINRGGEKISPREVDEVLLEHPAVEQVVTFAAPHTLLGEDVAAAVVLREGASATEQEIEAFVATRLADFKVPHVVVFVDEIPKGPTGKLQRIGLAEKLGITASNPAAPRPGYAAPRTPLEEHLAAIWSEVLDIEPVGIYERFLELQGDSILATRIINRVQTEMQVELSFLNFFLNPTIASMAAIVTEDRAKKNRQDAVCKLPTIVPAPALENQPFPLTEVQQAYWVGRGGTFELGNVSTHFYLEIESIDLDLARFNVALQKLINRHSMLRAIVLPDGEQQIIEEVPPYNIEVLDLCGLATEVVDAHLQNIRNRMSHHVLPSDRWPLFEIRASLVNEQLTRLHFSFDALILDAESRLLLFKEWFQLYQNPHTSLPNLELSFRDWVIAEKALRNSKIYQHSQNYWWNRLSTLPAAPQLPLAKNPRAIDKPRFVRRSSRLEAQTWQRLKQRASFASLTPSGVLLAAWAEVLKVWSNSPKFTINLTLFKRLPLHSQIQEILGDFTSLSLLAVDSSSEKTFEARAQRLQQQLWEDLDNSNISAVEVLRELARRQGGKAKVSMPVVFTSLLGHKTQFRDSQLSWLGNEVYSISQTPQVWIDHKVIEESEALEFVWDAVEELFPVGLLNEMFDAYCRFLQSLAEREETWQEDAAEITRQLMPQSQLVQQTALNAIEKEISATMLHTLFAEQVPKRLAQPAVVAANRTLTYAELSRRANQVGRKLRQVGAHPNQLVALVMEKGWEQVVAVLGVLASGAAYLPLEAGLPQERIWYILAEGEVELVLTQSWVDEKLTWPENVQRLCVDNDAVWGTDDRILEAVQKNTDLAYVIYTSGSTGSPKGVTIDHRGAVNTILDINQRFNVSSSDRVLALSSLSFDLSVYDIFGTLAAGGTIVLPQAEGTRDPSHWAQAIVREKITVWNSVPALMKLLTEYVATQPEISLNSLRLVLLSGDWLPITLPTRIKALAADVQVISLGGATEASIWSILYRVEQVNPDWESIPYGKPMTNQHVYVLNEVLEPCPVWVPGQLYIGGIGLSLGYWRDPAKTQSSFIIHPRTGERLYRTGDLGRYLPDNNIEFLGREDLQVKIQGHRIEVGEIETALRQHSQVSAAVVTAMGGLREEKRLVAYVVLNTSNSKSDSFLPPLTNSANQKLQSELRHFLQDKLPDYTIPSIFVMLDDLPLTANAKVDRKALPAPPDTNFQLAQLPEVSEATNLTIQISQLVARVLEVERVTPEANWLNLGATSVDLIRIANRLESELHFRPNLDELYDQPTALGVVRLYKQYQLSSSRPTEVIKANPNFVVTAAKILVDPEERLAFKNKQPGLRWHDVGKTALPLGISDSDEVLKKKYTGRSSVRQFVQHPILWQQFSDFLGCLRQISLDGKPKYLYPSAGGLYPVQTYLHIKPHRVDGVSAGTYYYHPVAHQLVRLSQKESLEATIYERLVNRPIYESAAFSIFFIAQMSAIAPIYGELARDFCLIEAGSMLQLVMSTAPGCKIGVCPIGSLDFQQIRHLFALDENHLVVHSLLGGGIDKSQLDSWSPLQEVYNSIAVTEKKEDNLAVPEEREEIEI